MDKSSVVFFGSGPVAYESLLQLMDGFTVEAIITKPATLHEMQSIAANIPVFAAANRRELEALIAKQPFTSRLAILIDFGIIVSKPVIDAFPLGIINSHFSLLPQWRGADPITFSILSGQRETGVSLMLLTEGLDEGPLLAQSVFPILESATTPTLTKDLIDLSTAMLKATVPSYIEGTCIAVDQLTATIAPTHEPTYSRKLTKEDGRLDWDKPASVLEREVRAYIEWPHSYTVLAGKDVIITAAQVAEMSGKPGSTITDKQHLYICCSVGALEILKLKPAGKQEMSAAAFLAGYRQLL